MFRTAVLVTALLAALLGVLLALGREAQRERSAGIGPGQVSGRIERCVSCHVKLDEDPGGAHSRAALGCASCHLGNPLAFDKARAHQGVEREPGALDTVDLTCGREGCHARQAGRVATSLMARGSGIISVDRWVFGEVPAPDGHDSFTRLLRPRPSPAGSHLRKLCAGCHLHTRRANRDDAIVGNGSGCAACHAPPRRPGDPPRRHPPVDSKVDDERCLGCHSRSGRISLSYQGLAEVEKDQRGACAAPTALHDGRPACRVAPDVHRAAGMACVDCHLHTDLMGDGTRHAHKEQQVEIACQSCHGEPQPAAPATWAGVTDATTRDLLRLRGETRPADEAVRTGRRGTPVWNLRPAAAGRPASDPATTWSLAGKLDGRLRRVKPAPRDANHTLGGHERLTCSACHAAWAPTCASCHVRFEPGRRQWDFAAAKETQGAWIESSHGFGWGTPALGVRGGTGDGAGPIVPAVPGMIFDLDAAKAGGSTSSHRLFAPLEPHTTGRKARDCASCHSSPAALGLGTGELAFTPKGPRFTPIEPDAKEPTLADDGWVPLFPVRPGAGTRTGFRSFDAAEQLRVLRVGACLPCHAKATDVIYRSFEAALDRLRGDGSGCRIRRAEWVAGRRTESRPLSSIAGQPKAGGT